MDATLVDEDLEPGFRPAQPVHDLGEALRFPSRDHIVGRAMVNLEVGEQVGEVYR